MGLLKSLYRSMPFGLPITLTGRDVDMDIDSDMVACILGALGGTLNTDPSSLWGVLGTT